MEGLFDEVWLLNAHQVKNAPGRKADLSDAEWLADVVVSRCRAFDGEVEAPREVPGLERTAIEIVLAETGGNMARFATAGHLAS